MTQSIVSPLATRWRSHLINSNLINCVGVARRRHRYNPHEPVG
ncbi:hypothetical protein [Nostoc sp. KVJ20]|nr:hypothetical protein [Nostoc sp. KVJ20]